MLGTFLKFISGGGFNAITSELRKAYSDKLQAQTSEQKLAADITINQLEMRQKALVQGKGAWITKLVQALWAFPFIVYCWKLVIWDKVLKLGVTDPLGVFESDIAKIIVAFYFLTTGVAYTIDKVRK